MMHGSLFSRSPALQLHVLQLCGDLKREVQRDERPSALGGLRRGWGEGNKGGVRGGGPGEWGEGLGCCRAGWLAG
jgi:hypothetical protein